MEVEGLLWEGERWYPDPLVIDTNQDGLADGLELAPTGVALQDTDDDGTPDLFDRDNDGDGVPDADDLSPFAKSSSSFSQGNPFQLVVDGLHDDEPTYVEFQLRPTNAQHLWYALNVLDWPRGDIEGQVQDYDGRTFKDVVPTTANAADDNGDVT